MLIIPSPKKNSILFLGTRVVVVTTLRLKAITFRPAFHKNKTRRKMPQQKNDCKKRGFFTAREIKAVEEKILSLMGTHQKGQLKLLELPLQFPKYLYLNFLKYYTLQFLLTFSTIASR